MGNEERIGVLAGGDSPEREISLVSGEHVHRALRDRGRDARLITIETLDDLFPALADVNVVFNCLHARSRDREDGYFFSDPADVLPLVHGPGHDVRLIDDYLPNDFTVICRKTSTD